jgi:hypothetical protein
MAVDMQPKPVHEKPVEQDFAVPLLAVRTECKLYQESSLKYFVP